MAVVAWRSLSYKSAIQRYAGVKRQKRADDRMCGSRMRARANNARTPTISIWFSGMIA